MQPLQPDDLIIRQQAPQQEEQRPSAPPVPLERFQELERIIRDIPLTSEPYIELAEIYRKNGRWSDARRVLEKAVGRFPDDLHLRYLFEEAQLSRSQELCGIAEAEYQAEPTQLTLEKLQRSELEWNVLRERVYRDRLARNPEQLELTLPLAEALEKLVRREESVELLKVASGQPALRAVASLQLGKQLEACERVPEALSAYRHAAMFRVPPPSPEIQLEALHRAADLAERSQMIDSARRYVLMLAEIQPHEKSFQERLERLQQWMPHHRQEEPQNL